MLHSGTSVQSEMLKDFLEAAYMSTSTTTTTTTEEELISKDNQELSQELEVEDEDNSQVHKVAGLNCDAYGGPSNDIAAEMIYWKDIKSDSSFVSPFYDDSKPKYLTFEPDEGGWNNIRMSMETAVAMAHAMGRTLVLPPQQGMYLLQKQKNDHRNGTKQQHQFGFSDFFHFDSFELEHAGVKVISFEDFLKREVLTGHLKEKGTNNNTVQIPITTKNSEPNRTDWNGIGRKEKDMLAKWMRTFTTNPVWYFDDCMVAFPSTNQDAQKRFDTMVDDITSVPWKQHMMLHKGHPVDVKASTHDRLREVLAHRSDVCLYNETYQNAKVFHFMGDNNSGARLLVHFYAYMFFEDWRQDTWTKRFVRDHLRYVDEIQCAAARVVAAIRKKAREHGNKDGLFDTFHIRRGDFQYKQTRIEADEILENIQDKLEPNSTIYIATDERNKTFFKPFFDQHYHIYFLDDFVEHIVEINSNFYGMLDQRIASRGRTFIGTYFSTFTGYINRMRGYHAQQSGIPKDALEQGTMNSWYYVPKQNVDAVSEYRTITPPMWAREFPLGWRDIDQGIGQLDQTSATKRRR